MANSFVLSKRKRRSEIWTDLQTHALISLWSAFQDDLKNAKRNRSVFETMAMRFNIENDSARTWEEVKNKISNLSKEYKREKIKEESGTTSNWRFWLPVHAILSSEPLIDDLIMPDEPDIIIEPNSNSAELTSDVPVVEDIELESILPGYDFGSHLSIPKRQLPRMKKNSSRNGLYKRGKPPIRPNKKQRILQENEKYLGILKELVQQQKVYQEEQQKSDNAFLTLVQETVQLQNNSLMLQEKIFGTLTTLQNNRGSPPAASETKDTHFLERRLSDIKSCDGGKYLDVLTELVQQQSQYQKDQQVKDQLFVNSMQETVTLQKKSFNLQEKMLQLLAVPKK